MQNKTENILTHAMKTGLILGIVLIVSEFCFFVMPFPEIGSVFGVLIFSGVSVMGLAFQIFCIFYFTRKYRDDVMGGNMSYMIALRYGFYMFFFAGLIFAACVYLCDLFMGVNYVVEKGSLELELMKHAKYSQSYIDSRQESIEEFVRNVSAPRLAWYSLSSVMLSGIVVLLFTSIFFRKKTN